MIPSFTNAVCYYITARCMTPLRTGSITNDPETILCNSQGKYIIQAASIVGAMRQWLESGDTPEVSEVLFGSQEQSGHLLLSDGIFDDNTYTTLRPRLQIDGATGAAMDGRKFDIRHVCTGSTFSFTIMWLGNSHQIGETEIVEQMLSAVHHGEILLGSHKSNGYGSVTLTVEKQCWDMYRAEDRTNWLSGVRRSSAVVLPRISRQQMVTFTLRAKASRILVKSGSVNYSVKQEKDQTIASGTIENMVENGIPVIPGSAIKGAIASRIRSIARYLQIPMDVVDAAFGRGNMENDNGIAGQCRFFDAQLNQCIQPVTRIRIDRFTGGVMTGGLFCSNPVTSELTLQIQVPAGMTAVCALMLFALRDLGLGLYTLGSGYAVGYGSLDVENITAISGSQTVIMHIDRDKNIIMEDVDGLASKWQRELGGICYAK